ncbi:MAG: portal protein, partial [Burkholderiales bacterium]
MPVNDAIASEMWSRFQICRDFGHLAFLEKADKCEKITVGDQWRVEDLNALTLARRPALTINKIISTLKAVLGEQINNRSETLFRPAEGGNDQTAEALTKVWMQIAQNNQLPWVRSEMFCDGLIRSRGFVDVRLDFDGSMRGDVRITNLNSKNVVIDPDAEEYDPDQWADVFVTKWMTPQDIAILYSEDDAEMLKAKDGSSFIYGYDSIERVRDRFGGPEALAAYAGSREPNGVRRNIRVLDRQYRKLDKQLHFVDIKTGDLRPVPTAWDRNKIALYLEQMQGTISTVKKLVRRVRWTVTADNVALHDDWSPYKHFTVVPYFPFFRYGRTAGMVEHLLSPQELLNKVSSQELHVVNTTANSGWKIRAGSLKNMSIEELEQKGAQSGLVLELDDPNNAEKITPNNTPQGLDRISFKAE